MEIVLAIAIGVLTGSGVYLLLRPRLKAKDGQAFLAARGM